jgi:hypothetical protein
MLQIIDNMEASCAINVKVGKFIQFEQRKISLLTINKSGIVTLTVQHEMSISTIF